MIIGIPREIKSDEYRVALLPVGAEILISEGHQVLIETGAGVGSGYDDSQYQNVGATLVNNPAEIFASSDMIVKVKEPIGSEFSMMRQGQIIFSFPMNDGSKRSASDRSEQTLTSLQLLYHTCYGRDLCFGIVQLDRSRLNRGTLDGGTVTMIR